MKKLIYFISQNDYKHNEVKEYFKNANIELIPKKFEIKEILDEDLVTIVRDKCIKAYEYIKSPCVVEHGGLLIEDLNGLPGGLSKRFWDKLGGKICKMLPDPQKRKAVAKVVVGYCDGKKVHTFEGETSGCIANDARGDYKFQWDPIFIPDGTTKTFAELGFPNKSNYSQARKAWEKCITFIENKDQTNISE